MHRNSSSSITQAPDDVDDRFNLRYGGIMDDDIREAAPLAVVKPSESQVNFCSSSHYGAQTRN